jgi:DNA-binding GntR family transcriptional regulator
MVLQLSTTVVRQALLQIVHHRLLDEAFGRLRTVLARNTK